MKSRKSSKPSKANAESSPVSRLFDHIRIESLSRELHPDYTATCVELRALARHWARVECDFNLFVEVYGKHGRPDDRPILHAKKRLAAIANCIGEENVKSIREEVEKELLDEMPAETRAELAARRDNAGKLNVLCSDLETIDHFVFEAVDHLRALAEDRPPRMTPQEAAESLELARGSIATLQDEMESFFRRLFKPKSGE